MLEKLIRGSELIVLATPLDFMPENGFLNPSFSARCQGDVAQRESPSPGASGQPRLRASQSGR